MHSDSSTRTIASPSLSGANNGRTSLATKSNGAISSAVLMAVSPSLRQRVPGELPAFEMKFLLDADKAAQVEAWLQPRLWPDPHTNPDLGNGYCVTTVYCDTPQLATFHRIGRHRRRKYRLRRYGNESWVFLERKTKLGERVRKRRATIDASELPLLSAFSASDDWPAHWFHK